MSSQSKEDRTAFREAVREATSIVELISRDHPSLHESGSCYRGADGWPSLIVYEESGHWIDFGGNREGDCFEWLIQIHNLTFVEALNQLADEAGIERPDWTPEEKQEEDERRQVVRMRTEAAKYWHRCLSRKLRKKVLKDGYGFTDETIDKQLIGWADGTLHLHLKDRFPDATDEDLLKTGLVQPCKSSNKHPFNLRDFFEDRLMFPYLIRGQSHYEIGRRVEGYTPDTEWELAKYKKTPVKGPKRQEVSETVENDIFYNEDAVRGAEEILVTEGVTDCISALQAGVPCISPVTVRYNKKQLPRFRRLIANVKRVVICNDAEINRSGEKGAVAMVADLFPDVDVRIGRLPVPDGAEKIDVNEYCNQNLETAGDRLRAVMAEARALPEFLLDGVDMESGESIDDKLVPICDALCQMSGAGKDGYVNQIAKKFSITKTSVKQAIAKAAERRRRSEKPATQEGEGLASRKRMAGDVVQTEGINNYFVVNAQGDIMAISSFVVEVTQRIRLNDQVLIGGTIHTDKRGSIENVVFPVSAWNSKRSFVSTLTRIDPDLQFTGTDNHVQGILRILADADVPTREGTDVIGVYKSKDGPRWVAPGIVIGPAGVITDEHLAYVEDGNPLAQRLKYEQLDAKEEAKLAAEALPLLLQVHEDGVIVPLLAWYFAAPLKTFVVEKIGHFPIGWTWGTAGSGKSTLNTLLWRLLGVWMNDAFSSTETRFSQLRIFSGTNGVPVVCDEFKPGDMLKTQVDLMLRNVRKLYNGESESRGRPDLGMKNYHYRAPLMVVGEAMPNEPAVRERCLIASPLKTHLAAHPEAVSAYARLRQLELHKLAISYIAWTLRAAQDGTLEQFWRSAREITHAELGRIRGADRLAQRVLDNLTVMMFGFMSFDAYAGDMGAEMPEVDMQPVIRSQIANIVGDEGSDGEIGAMRDALDIFLEACSTMAVSGQLIEDTHYTIVDGTLRMHLGACHAAYVTWQRSQGLGDETNGLNALRRVIREKRREDGADGFVEHRPRRTNLSSPDGDKKVFARCVSFRMEHAPNHLNLESFMTEEKRQRSWGGERWDADEDDSTG